MLESPLFWSILSIATPSILSLVGLWFSRKAKKATINRPQEVLTDGLRSYPKAIVKELGKRGVEGTRGFWSPYKRVPSIKAKNSNNRIERLHGTEKERTKVMRGFDQEHGCQTLMEGFRVHYNLVKTHQALGCTPTEATGNTSLNGFKWLNIIQKASNNNIFPIISFKPLK